MACVNLLPDALLSGVPSVTTYPSRMTPRKTSARAVSVLSPCLHMRRTSGQLGMHSPSLFCARIQVGTLERKRQFRVACESGDANQTKGKVPFGYTRKDVIGIGVGITLLGVGTKYGLEFLGADAAQAGNVVQVILVLGLMLGWVGSYVFRVGNKEMTYVKQLKDYEDAVMQKRLEELPETELEAMLAEVEEEKRRLQARKKASKDA